MLCKKCGTENKEGTKFCKKCGAKINEESNINEVTTLCKKCGTENKEGTTFCKKCGNPLNTGNSQKTVSSIENKSNWHKTKRNKILAGVCAGLSEKWNINPWILRIILIVSNFFVIGWFLDIAYVILIFKLKYDDEDSFVNSNITSNVQAKISNILPQKEKIKKQRKVRTFEDEESKELSNDSESAEKPISHKADYKALAEEKPEDLFSYSEPAEIPFSPEVDYEPSVEEDPEELFNNSEPEEKLFSTKPDYEPSAEGEYEEIFSYSEPVKKPISANSTKKEKSHKAPRLSTIILAVLLAVVVLALGLFMFLYFNKGNNSDSEKKQSSNPTATETSTEKETEVTTTEAETETETETETEEETGYDEELEEDEDDDEFTEYTLRLYKGLPYYQFPRYDSRKNGVITSTTIYTIVEEIFDENNERWGKLLSGVGWVNLSENDSWAQYDTSYYNPSSHPEIKKKTVDGITFLYRKTSDSNNDGSYSEKIKDLKISTAKPNAYDKAFNLKLKGEVVGNKYNLGKQIMATILDKDYNMVDRYNLSEEINEDNFKCAVFYEVLRPETKYVYIEISVYDKDIFGYGM